jgi:hypothetical protein
MGNQDSAAIESDPDESQGEIKYMDNETQDNEEEK